MDEPLSNLDAKLRVQMRAELKRFHQDLSATIIYVTHDQLEAVTMADKMAVMDGGYLQQYDSPDHIYNHPVNTFVAGFVGSPAMNLLEGYVKQTGDVVSIANDDGWEYPLSDSTSRKALMSSTPAVVIGLRHTAILVHTERVGNSVPAKVYTVEPTGDITFVHAKLGDQMIVVSVAPSVHIRADDNIYLEFDQDRMHIFDGVTQQTLEMH